MAMMRCHPGTKYRFLFDYAHSAVGVVALLLASTAIFKATEEDFPKITLEDGARGVTIAHFAVFAAFHLAATVYTFFFLKPREKCDKRPDVFLLGALIGFVVAAISITTAMVVYIVKFDPEEDA